MNFYGGSNSLAETYKIKGASHFDMAKYSEAIEAFQKAKNLILMIELSGLISVNHITG